MFWKSDYVLMELHGKQLTMLTTKVEKSIESIRNLKTFLFHIIILIQLENGLD